MNSIIPIPQSAIAIRPGTLADLPFIDGLQKANSKNVGFLRAKALEGKIAAGHVLIAESGMGLQPMSCVEDTGYKPVPRGSSLGYVIGNDKYMKREDVGIIYQLNVAPGTRRKLVGATLIQALFARSAYGCRLFCCWCAQDIEANHFWEALGFIPLAFRTGSRGKGCRPQARVHIFWQRRIREGDVSTPWWFPSQTSAGSIGEDRLVLPIPPGTHWSDAMPLILPKHEPKPKRLTDPSANPARKPRQKVIEPQKIARLGGVSFTPPAPPKAEKPQRQKKPKMKNDPAHVAAVRDINSRYLEQFNAGTVLLTAGLAGGKYNISRTLQCRRPAESVLLLEQQAA